ncbi:spore coat protein YlbD [Mycoplasmatota bacterium WC44]
MGKSIEEFREFVKNYPKLKFKVRDGERTWQNIYEEWSMLGEESFENFKEEEGILSSAESQETLRSVLKYAQLINADNITKTLNTVQKVMQIFQGLSSFTNNKTNVNVQDNRDPLFRRFTKWD